MSNLIKSGFVLFSDDDVLKIDANDNKVIRGIDSDIKEESFSTETSVEEAIAEAMLDEAELEGLELTDAGSRLTMDSSELSATVEDDGTGLASAEDIISSAKKEAEEIVNSAYDEAEKMRGAAYDEAQSIKEQARKDGYQAGYDEGSGTAFKEYEEKNKELESMRASFEEEMRQREEDLINQTTNCMTDWLIKMVYHITGVSIEGVEGVLMYMINNAMHDLDNSRHFVIKVSPDDYSDISEHKDEIYGALNPGIDLEVFEDSKLSKLQCIIETDNGVVDVGLDTQLDNLIKALKLLKVE